MACLCMRACLYEHMYKYSCIFLWSVLQKELLKVYRETHRQKQNSVNLYLAEAWNVLAVLTASCLEIHLLIAVTTTEHTP